MSPYLATLGAALRAALQYRAAALAGVFTQTFWGVLRITVFVAFYAALAPGERAPLELRQVVDYVWLSQALIAIVPTQRDASIEAMMRDGTIAYELARPVDVYSFWYARALSQRLGSVLLRAPVLVLVATLVVPAEIALRAPASAAGLLAFALSILFALLVSAALVVLVGVFTLHAVRGQGAALLVGASAWMLSGLLLPAPLLPAPFGTLMEWLPFAAILDLPLRLYVGQIEPHVALPILLRQVGWILGLIVLGRALLGRALSRVVVQGG